MSTVPAQPANSDSSGFTLGFMLGMLVGGAGGYFFSTPKGKKLFNQLKVQFSEELNDFIDNPNLSEKLANLEEAMHQAQAKLKQVTPKKRTFLRHGTPLK